MQNLNAKQNKTKGCTSMDFAFTLYEFIDINMKDNK